MLDQAHTIVYVSDVRRCAAFSRDILGMPVQMIGDDRARVQMNGASLLLLPRDEHQTGAAGRIHLALDVGDVDKAYHDLSEKSVVFASAPADTSFGKQATMCDPDGTPIDLIEWAKPDMERVSDGTVVNEILARSPEAMEVLEDHGIRICGGCIVLLNGTVKETAEFSGLSPVESAAMVHELNEKLGRSL